MSFALKVGTWKAYKKGKELWIAWTFQLGNEGWARWDMVQHYLGDERKEFIAMAMAHGYKTGQLCAWFYKDSQI